MHYEGGTWQIKNGSFVFYRGIFGRRYIGFEAGEVGEGPLYLQRRHFRVPVKHLGPEVVRLSLDAADLDSLASQAERTLVSLGIYQNDWRRVAAVELRKLSTEIFFAEARQEMQRRDNSTETSFASQS